jgi:DeoR/GlpR family transcriptional regulator of sugar metabolism
VLQRKDLQLIMLGGSVDAHVGGCIDATTLRQLADLASGPLLSSALAPFP